MNETMSERYITRPDTYPPLAGRGMTVDQMLEWSWLFNDPEFWKAVDEISDGRKWHREMYRNE